MSLFTARQTVGLGVYKASNEETISAVSLALKLGYRHIDTAQIYGNEAAVGRAMVGSAVPRSEIFVTTKLWEDGYGDVVASLRRSLERLNVSYVDLFLVHSPPAPGVFQRVWEGMQACQELGLARAVGVSNYGAHHLERLSGAKIKPAVNQLEVHPFLQRRALVKACADMGIAVEAYSPLVKGQKMDDPALVAVAKEANRSPAQVLVKWSLQKGFIPLPKSVKEQRLVENFDVFDWQLTPQQIEALDGLEANLITGWDPTTRP
jgi:diketogulonate reductase-like aldo/keto reductase